LERPGNLTNGTGDVSLAVTFQTDSGSQIQPLVVLGKTSRADLIGLRLPDADHFSVFYESWGGGTAESAPITIPRTREATLRVRIGAMYRGDGPAGAVLGDSIVVWLDGSPVWWAHEGREIGADAPLDIAANTIGSSVMLPYFKGRIRGWSRGPAPAAWHAGPFDALEMDLAERGEGSEPLAATGPAGLADTVAIEWLPAGKARLAYDHWGHGATFSAPFDWSAGRMHTVRLEMPSFSRLDARNLPSAGLGRLEAEIDGRTVWETSVSFYVVPSDTVSLGRNRSGSTIAGVRLSCVVADVRQSGQDETR
jgi:hypothetical protein